MNPAELQGYIDAAVALASSPYGGLAVLAGFALYLWKKLSSELEQCRADREADRRENSKLNAAVDGLYEAVCLLAEPPGYRVISLEWIKDGKRPVLIPKRAAREPEPPRDKYDMTL